MNHAKFVSENYFSIRYFSEQHTSQTPLKTHRNFHISKASPIKKINCCGKGRAPDLYNQHISFRGHGNCCLQQVYHILQIIHLLHNAVLSSHSNLLLPSPVKSFVSTEFRNCAFLPPWEVTCLFSTLSRKAGPFLEDRKKVWVSICHLPPWLPFCTVWFITQNVSLSSQ